MKNSAAPRVAIVHDWLNGMRGGERVLEAILELFPKATIFTLFYERDKISKLIGQHEIRASVLQRFSFFHRFYRHFLPLLPFLIRQLDLSGFDLIISSSHCVAKGIRRPKGAVHVSYVHAPMRYVWDRFEDYFGKDRASLIVRLVGTILRPFLQRWDRKISQESNVDTLIANSHFIAAQIKSAYHRDAQVIHPFVDFERFQKPKNSKSASNLVGPEGRPYYLVVSAFAPNKRVDLAIRACLELGRDLKIVGSGQDAQRLLELREAGSTKEQSGSIEFLGSISDHLITEYYLNCRAFLFPGVEDFGITPLEAMAAGAPVIAYRHGGVCETVTEKTGIFFETQSMDALKAAILRFEAESSRFNEADCRSRAREFSKGEFQGKLLKLLPESVDKKDNQI